MRRVLPLDPEAYSVTDQTRLVFRQRFDFLSKFSFGSHSGRAEVVFLKYQSIPRRLSSFLGVRDSIHEPKFENFPDLMEKQAPETRGARSNTLAANSF